MAHVENVMWVPYKGKAKNPVAGRRDGQCSTCVGDKEIYVFGGLLQDAEGRTEETNDLLRFDVKSGWNVVKSTGDAPPVRSLAAMASVGRCLFLFGGLNQQDGWLNDLHVFDLESNIWKRVDTQGLRPSPRDKAAITVVGDTIYLFGGFGPLAVIDEDDDDDDEDDGHELHAYERSQEAAVFGWFNDLYILNTATYTWSQPMQMNLGAPTARAASAMCTLNNSQLFIFGGRDATGRCNDGYLFDTVTRKWTSVQQAKGSPPKPRSFHSVTAFGDRAVVFGGRGSGNEHYNDLFVYDSVGNEWSLLPIGGVSNAPTARGCHSAGRIDNSLVVYGGSGNFNEDVQQCMEFYDDTYLIDLSASMKETVSVE